MAVSDTPAAALATELCAWTGVGLGGAKVPSAPRDGDNPEQCVSAAHPPSLSPSPPSVLGPDLVCLAGPRTSQSCPALHPLKTGAAGGTCKACTLGIHAFLCSPAQAYPFSVVRTSRLDSCYLVTPGGGVPVWSLHLETCPSSLMPRALLRTVLPSPFSWWTGRQAYLF